MATVTVGNAHVGAKCLVPYEFEDDDGSPFSLDLEYAGECELIGYCKTLGSGSAGRSVTVRLYHRTPTSPEYDDYIGIGGGEYIPVVYLMADGKPSVLLNASLGEVKTARNFTGWVTGTVALTRELQKGETIWAGFFSVWGYPVWDAPFSGNGSPYNSKTYGYYSLSSAKTAIQNGSILRGGAELSATAYSCYWEYTEERLAVAYTRSVAGAVGARSAIGRGVSLRRGFTESGRVRGVAGGAARLCRVCGGSGRAFDGAERRVLVARGFTGGVAACGGVARRAGYARLTGEDKRVGDTATRVAGFTRSGADAFLPLDTLSRRLRLFAGIVSLAGVWEAAGRSTEARRLAQSESGVSGSVRVGRIVFRAAVTVCGVWDWLTGKIRSENCVVELFTPITDTLELECRI